MARLPHLTLRCCRPEGLDEEFLLLAEVVPKEDQCCDELNDKEGETDGAHVPFGDLDNRVIGGDGEVRPQEQQRSDDEDAGSAEDLTGQLVRIIELLGHQPGTKKAKEAAPEEHDDHSECER